MFEETRERPALFSLKLYDKPSLVWAYRLAPAMRIEDEAACEATHVQPAWLHFNLNDAPARRWLSARAALPPAAVAAMFDARPRPFVTRTAEGVIGVLIDLHHDFQGDPEAFGELRFFVDAQRIISARRHPLRTVDVLRRRLDHGHGLDDPRAFLEQLTTALAESFGDVVAELTQRVDAIEDDVLAGVGLDQRAPLADIRRLLTRFRRHVHHDRSALHGAVLDGDEHPDQPQLSRKALAQLDGVAQDLDLVHERVRLLQDEVSELLAEANNRILYLLSVVTTMLLPATLIASMWGMNVGGVPFSEDPHGFMWVSGLVFASIVLALVGLRKLRGR